MKRQWIMRQSVQMALLFVFTKKFKKMAVSGFQKGYGFVKLFGKYQKYFINFGNHNVKYYRFCCYQL